MWRPDENTGEVRGEFPVYDINWAPASAVGREVRTARWWGGGGGDPRGVPPSCKLQGDCNCPESKGHLMESAHPQATPSRHASSGRIPSPSVAQRSCPAAPGGSLLSVTCSWGSYIYHTWNHLSRWFREGWGQVCPGFFVPSPKHRRWPIVSAQ